MNLSSLKPAKGSTKNKKRLGRGEGSGRGGTSTKGHKGAKSRSGYKAKRGYEGGQMPLQRVVPKFGFKNRNRIAYKAINLKHLQNIAEKHNIDTIDLQVLYDNGMASRRDLVKILGDGNITVKLTVKAHAFSKKAVEKIEAIGGIIEKI